MLAIYILLIPIKLLIKLLGYMIVGILKLIATVIIFISYSCGWITTILGSIMTLGALVYTIFALANISHLRENDYWWVTSVVSFIIGAIIGSLAVWAELLGMTISGWGDDLAISLSMMRLLPD